MRLFNDGWEFAKGKPENFAPVRLPHDWLIADPSGFYQSGVGWYRRTLDAGFLREGQRLSLVFDGVYMDCALFVNNQAAGEWKYGYTAFELDLTDLLFTDRPNALLLRVNYQAPSGRWYTGAGIYRDVFLRVKNACRFVRDGIYVTTSWREGAWRYEVDAQVETGNRPYALRHTLLEAGEAIEAWDVEHPRLYTLRSELLVDGRVMDTEHTRFGFRRIDFTPDKGFFLNGRAVKLKGVCLHHDLGALGAAVHRDAIRRQLECMRAMGVNALRTAHNPPARAFMELADEMGFLVLSEFTDIWKSPKNPFDYARFFEEWVERDVASWIRRDRNCPSVILWSVGNEIADTHTDAREGAKTLRRLLALVQAHDPKGHAAATLCSNYLPWENTQRCADLVKLVGYNYGEALYESHRRSHPDWILYGSETCATVQSRGVYHFPLSQSVLADDDLQCSALGNSATSWGSRSVEACIRADLDAPYSLGQFIWAGQDYLGEPTPYHTKSAYLGHVDTAGFPKDSYHIFQAAWTDPTQAPMVHLFPYWDFSPGQLVDVRVCSNAPRVALFLDGKRLGKAELAGRWVADFQVPYSPGTLRAVAYDQDFRPIAEACRRSFGEVARLRLATALYPELAFVTLSAEDEDGHTVENASSRVHVSVEDGELLGLDNGDAADWEPYAAGSRRMFGGKLLAIVRRQGDKEPRVFARLCETDVPIRKIELTQSGDTVSAKILPPRATHTALTWRLANAAGIDSPLGSLRVAEDGRSVTVIPRSDGEAYVRCMASNGRDHPTLISLLKLTFAGKGRLFLNPYAFVSGGLYNASNLPLTNGNERGVATLRDGESHVGFRDLDFGAYGSDEITLSLFPLDKAPFDFEIWEGMPSEGGSRVHTARYDKGSIWNTYQDAAYRLPRRLRGVTTLCLVFRQKVHVKGFCFQKLEKAFARLPAAENDGLYGDAFTVAGSAVEGIGNNVTLLFRDMDFGEAGASRVALCWRSQKDQNPVHLLFSGEGEAVRDVVNAGRSEAYQSAEFPLAQTIRGLNTVSLLFLPGSRLDLAWVQFLA